jgi:hypothetical protein
MYTDDVDVRKFRFNFNFRGDYDDITARAVGKKELSRQSRTRRRRGYQNDERFAIEETISETFLSSRIFFILGKRNAKPLSCLLLF